MEAVPINTTDPPDVILEMIYRIKVKDVMSFPVITAKPEDSLRSIQEKMRDMRISGIPIVRDGRLEGIVSIGDIVVALDEGLIGEKAESRMSTGVIVLEDDMPLSFAISYMNKYRYGRFPVLNKDQSIVGVVTAKDIIRALLVEMNREVERLEARIGSRAVSGKTGKTLEFLTVRYDFENAGKASMELKRTLKDSGVDPAIVRRAAVASYELELNQVIHSVGGTMRFVVSGDGIEIVAADSGPGIADIEAAMREGWSTANDWIRSLGFGAGMGLANAKRVSDEFEIKSAAGAGTTVRAFIKAGTAGEVQADIGGRME
jgi:CBS domain-containing protein